MRRLISIALSILCIALPLRAIADAVASGEHCPRMQAETSADSSGGHDCCNDAATFAKTGQLCKMGQECSPPMTYLLPPTVLQVFVATQHSVVITPPTHLYSRPPAAVWRPPSLS